MAFGESVAAAGERIVNEFRKVRCRYRCRRRRRTASCLYERCNPLGSSGVEQIDRMHSCCECKRGQASQAVCSAGKRDEGSGRHTRRTGPNDMAPSELFRPSSFYWLSSQA